MLRRLFTFFLFIFSMATVKGQVNIHFMPELHGRSVDGLLNLRLMNISGPQAVTLSLVVAEKRHGRVVVIRTEPFTLSNGNNAVPSTAIRNAKVQFTGNSISANIEQNGYFPEGDYEYCFTISPASNNTNSEGPSEQCFNQELVPTAPLNLIEPYNKDKICEKRPLLSWQPSFPEIRGAAYQLVLVEVKDGQNATEALNYNLPIIIQAGISYPILAYPPSAKELVAGKKYAWQVSMYKNRSILNRSEVWEFTVGCEDSEEKPVVINNGYRDIEDLLKGNFYVAHGVLKFVLINSYGDHTLPYSIVCLTAPSLKIKRLPKIDVKAGKNKIDILLSNNMAFKDSFYYIMKIQLPNGSEKELRFLYKDIK